MCNEGSSIFNPTADNDSNNPTALPGGIFDLENPENPFADYNMVFVPYCTGDVHIGNREATYEVEASDGSNHHLPLRL
ncbi:MAG: hypothetical protein HND46_11645 [Chloroflexi bacterium]|nr:hypothetical protein [Chloroflexota bacterium]NOG64068.1 hypothetical protein [Chloroflexota bacterium]